MDKEIYYSIDKGIAHVTLNRPQVMNAINRDMTALLFGWLEFWEKDPEVRAVVITGAGDRAFCAGGDLKLIYDLKQQGKVETAQQFFREEYTLNHRIFHFPKPYIAIIDGLTMGGGVGISIHGSDRIVTERTLFAMPETGIGLFPDIGASYFLPRCPDHLGLYLGLTGSRINAADMLYVGLADIFVPAQNIPALLEELKGARDIDKTIEQYRQDPGPSDLQKQESWVNSHFTGDSVEEIMGSLAKDKTEWAAQTLQTLKAKSPTSLKITYRQLTTKNLTLDQALQMEYRLAYRCLEGHDFYEGIRAAVIDKDHRPNWQPATDVADIDGYFTSLGEKEMKL